MTKYRVIFHNHMMGGLEYKDILAHSARDATEKWKNDRTSKEKANLEWCGCFKTPSRLFTVEDFS